MEHPAPAEFQPLTTEHYMDPNPLCAVCAERNWSRLGAKVYKKQDVDNLDRYQEIRHEVLFDVWFDNAVEVELKTIVCKTCGFVCYSPRPTRFDIDKKYSYINSHPASSHEYTAHLPSDEIRSKELYKFLKRYLQGGSKRVLDFGGGNGRLLSEFLKHGHKCGIVDYVDNVVSGVNYLGSCLSNIPSHISYDLAICSHVLEHLANPLEKLRQLIPVLRPDGIIYIEVPSEIWRQPPPAIDPVTHINFFTTDSLRSLMDISGIRVFECRYETFTRPNGMVGLAIKAVGTPRREFEPKNICFAGSDLVERMINARFIDRVLRVVRHPRFLLNILRKTQ